MIEQIKQDDIPKSVDKLIEFWSQEGIVELTQPTAVHADIINHLQWVGHLLGEVERLKGIDERESRIAISIHRKNKELQKALEWYADEANHKDLIFDKFVPYTAMDQDEGERARQALKGSEPK